MYKIAICDDDELTLTHLYEMLSDILSEPGNPVFNIEKFSNTTELFACISRNPSAFHLLLLDIEMQEGISGMELAHQLRELKNRVSIIFITGSEEYLKEGYSVQPVHFLLKPVSRQTLSDALNMDLQNNYLPKSITLEVGKRFVNLDLEYLLYIESVNHTLFIHTETETITVTLPLNRLMELLPADSFCRCHKSYIVNMRHIADLQPSQITLKNGHALPIGRSYQRDAHTRFVRFLNRF